MSMRMIMRGGFHAGFYLVLAPLFLTVVSLLACQRACERREWSLFACCIPPHKLKYNTLYALPPPNRT